MPQPVTDLCIEQSIWSTEKEKMKESVQNIRTKIQIYSSLFKTQISENMKQKDAFFAKMFEAKEKKDLIQATQINAFMKSKNSQSKGV